jgi:hypothetical protein
MIKLDYDEISPITNNLCVIVEALDNGMNSYMCMESGFVTNDSLRIGSDMIDIYEEHISQLMRDVKHIDETRGLVWYPTYIQVGQFVLYCTGTSMKDIGWEVAQIVPLTDDEMKNYPIPGRNAEYYQSRVDTDSAKFYIDFESAMNSLYASVEKFYHENLETES